MTDTTLTQPHIEIPAWVMSALSVFVIVALPVLLVLINARLLMTDAYLNFAYNSGIVPPDQYRYPPLSREESAPLALAYLFNDEDIDFLGDQTFSTGEPLYNERELSHMVDVKVVTQGLVRFGFILLGLTILAGTTIAFGDPKQLLIALRSGSFLTAGLIASGLFAVGTSFNWLFTQFHNLFFEEGTWLFLLSDTLIRLFPIEFWALAFGLMFGFALIEAAVIGGLSWWGLRHATMQPE
ncbi:MAG: DUF1461 domain-containing protein [Chloroflexi bacterium]|nr:DUF1461 domain-containing protein [Chloroflexota bacterium]